MKIRKRNGNLVEFDVSKIENAIKKAFRDVKEDVEEDLKLIVKNVSSKCYDGIRVEDIQDLVVENLIKNNHVNVGLAYQTYRTLRDDIRNKENVIYKQVEGIFNATDADILNENTNKDSRTLSVQRDLLAGVTSKDYYLNKILPKHIKEAHLKGEIHVHDLDYLVGKYTNCEVINLERMLKGGCKIGNADMAEPKSIEVAIGHTVQIIASISSNTYGGCSVPYFDRDLIPYIRKTFIKHYNNGRKFIENKCKISLDNNLYFDKDWTDMYKGLKEESEKAYNYAMELTKESVKQSIQGFEYEINSLSTINGQTPFTTIGIGTETSWEGRLVQEEVFKQRMGGFGKNKNNVVVFPKIVFAVCDEINLNDDSPNHDIMMLGAECMVKSIYPDILFVSKEEVDREEVLYPMGCRAFLSEFKNEDGYNIIKGRGNLGAVSVNLPRLAIQNIGNEEGFYKELDRVLDICRDNCLFRINYLKGIKSDIAPIIWQSGAIMELKTGEEIKDIFENGYMTISIGYIGLSEVSQLLYGEDFAYNEDIYKKCIKIMEHIREKIDTYKKETGIGFALYSTPSEGLCKRFAEMDKKAFGDIKGVTDKGYYDNSFHVSSHININPFEKLRLEAPFHKIASGGHISYIESDSLKNNIGAIIDILKYGKSVGIHYMGINQPVDSCHKCGFEGEFAIDENGFHCPNCGNRDSDSINVIRRVSGYLSQPNDRPFNTGKQKEMMARVKHK